MRRTWRVVLGTLVCLLVSAFSLPAHAFYEYYGDKLEIDIRAFNRLGVSVFQTPDGTLQWVDSINAVVPAEQQVDLHRRDTQSLALNRLLFNAYYGDVKVEFNGYHVWLADTAGAYVGESGGLVGIQLPATRSSAMRFDWAEDASGRGHFDVDWLNIKLTGDKYTVKVGRQPMNLATTFFFTPNDFFGPFASTAFFRAYKVGVDGVSANVQLGEFTQLELFGVMGYEGGLKDNDPSIRDSAGIARASTVVGLFEVGAVGGRLERGYVAGADFQGEVFEYWAVRGEGHYAMPAKRAASAFEGALGIDRRFEGGYTVQAEYFFHGAGNAKDDYFQGFSNLSARLPYLGQHYGALGLNYEWSALTNINAAVLSNLQDPSATVTGYIVRSVSDEAEIAATANVPIGEGIQLNDGLFPDVKSEFGLQPLTVNAEFRVYF